MTPDGTWQLVIRTPVGSLPVELIVTGDANGYAGIARGPGHDIVIPHITVTPQPDGQHLTWTQQVTKPLRLTLQFDVLVTGDTLNGTARAGRLPPSQVSGTRIPG